jgi:type I restriction enzyme M protein
VQLIDGTRHFQKMRKSLGNKRNELGEQHIAELVRLYGEYEQDATSEVVIDSKREQRVCVKLFDNRDFGYLKIAVERPLRLNFQASQERIDRLGEQSAFANLASSKKKEPVARQLEIETGEAQQQAIVALLQGLDGTVLYRSRPDFVRVLDGACKAAGLKLDAAQKKAVLAALSERDPQAEICRDSKGNPEPDPELRDNETVPLPATIPLPLPLGFDNETNHDELLALVRDHCTTYLIAEVLPHVPDAWIDHSKTKVGYEIPINRHFYVYQPPRPLAEIEADIKTLEADILSMLAEVV